MSEAPAFEKLPPRLDLINPADLDDAQRALYEAITGGPRASQAGTVPIVDEAARLLGPFAVMLLTPEVGNAMQQVGAKIRFSTALTARERELAILAVAGVLRSDFERLAHEPAALRAGLTREQVNAVLSGQAPEGLTTDEALIGRLAQAMTAERNLTDEDYAAGVAGLGEERLAELTWLVGYYSALALALAVFRPFIPDSFWAAHDRATGELSRVTRAGLPRHSSETVDEAAGARRGGLGGERDDRVGALGDGLRAAVPVEVGGRVAGIDGVEPDVRPRLGVLHGQHGDRRLGGGVERGGDRRLDAVRVVGEGERAHAAADVDDRGRVRLPEQRQERVRDADDAQHVRVEHQPRVVTGEIRGGDPPAGDARVVDEHVDAALAGFDVGGGPRHRRVVRHVDRHEADTEPGGGGRAALRVAGAEDDGVAAFGQAAGGLEAEALVRPGDEGDRVHGSQPAAPRAGQPGTPRR
jgi:AhpD family alkylhydroperoxidase